ncbi:MAG: energy transducer TonB [Pseudobdellovibrionaceae bacterium]
MEFNGLKNYQSVNMPPLNVIENKSGRFLSVSVLLHAALLASVALMNVPPIELPKNKVVELEVENEPMPAAGSPVPETKGSAPVAAAAPAAPVAPAVLPPAPATAHPVPSQPAVAVKPAPAALSPSSGKVALALASPASVPETLEDIQAPALETSEVGEVAVAQMDEKELQEDFEKVDQTQNKALALAKKSLDEDTDKAAAEGDAALSEIDKETQAENKALKIAADKRRAQEAAAIAAAEASEKAAADTLARQSAKGSAEDGEGSADEGKGTGSQGSPEPTKEVAGIPGGVRSLGQLRQKPGNKFPHYSKEERLARQEGQAVFYAYVNKDGSLSQFKLAESTGHDNLDAKTLAALEKWKFYPGQEGWVEMPFKWILSGEALEAGGQLRNQ